MIINVLLRVWIDENIFLYNIFKVFEWLILKVPRIEQILRFEVAEAIKGLQVQHVDHAVLGGKG